MWIDNTGVGIIDEADKGAENVPEEISKTNLNDSFEDWNGAELKMCKDLVYKMTLNNTKDHMVLFKIKLSPKSYSTLWAIFNENDFIR